MPPAAMTTARRAAAALASALLLAALVVAAARPLSPPPPPAPVLAATYAQHRSGSGSGSSAHHSGERHSGGGGSSSSSSSSSSSKHHNGSNGNGRLGAAQKCKDNPINPNGDDLVTDWHKNCDDKAAGGDNYWCHACLLYRDVVDRKPSADYIYSGDSRRSKIIPVRPTTGVESVVAGAPSSKLWDTAIKDAIAGNVINPNIPSIKRPVAYVNSLDARSQHQLHIHIGAPLPTFYACARGLIDKPPKTGQWSKLAETSSGACGDLTIPKSKYGVAMAVTSVAPDNVDAAIRDGFKTPQVPGAKGGDMYTDPVLMRTGVLVQPNEQNSKELLVFLIYNTDDDMIYGV